MKNEIIEHFKKFKKITITATLKYFKTHKDDEILINNILKNEPEWETPQNVIIGLINDLKLNTCKLCGKKIKFSKIDSIYCSTKCLNNDQDIRDKIKNTCIKKYGVDNAAKSNEIKIKAKNTCIKKYGVDNAAKSAEIQNKIKNTCIERYGTETVFQAKSVIDKIKKTKLERYNDSGYTNSDLRRQTLLRQHYNEFRTKFKDIEPMFSLEEYTGVGYYDKYKWRCKKCGNVFEDHFFSHTPTCKKCNPSLSGISMKEKELLDFCKSFFDNVIENDHHLIKPYELDIVIPKINLAIEFNGNYWHSVEGFSRYYDNDYSKFYHLNKILKCNEIGFRLVNIWENEWDENKKELMKKMKQIFLNEEMIDFSSKLDMSWFNNLKTERKIVKIDDPEIIKRDRFNVYNAGYLHFE